MSVDFSLIQNTSDRTVVLGSTQSLTEMSTRNISWAKSGRCVRLTTYLYPVPMSRNLGTLTSWNPLGPSGPVTGLLYLYLLPLLFHINIRSTFCSDRHVTGEICNRYLVKGRSCLMFSCFFALRSYRTVSTVCHIQQLSHPESALTSAE